MGGFNLKHFLLPASGGGVLGFLDPANAFGTVSKGGASAASSIASAPVPVPAPPVTGSAAEVIAAEHDIAQQNLLKKSVKKTILAGDTGGFKLSGANPANAAGAPATYRSPRG